MKKLLALTALLSLVAVAAFASGPAPQDQAFRNYFHWTGTGGHILVDSTLNKGSVTCSGSAGTATVTAGSVCVCSEQTDITKLVKCSVSTTTLTIACTSSDVISYVCL